MTFKFNDFRDIRHVVKGLDPQKENVIAMIFPTGLFKKYCRDNNLTGKLNIMRLLSIVSATIYIVALVYIGHIAISTEGHFSTVPIDEFFTPSLLFLLGIAINFVAHDHMSEIQTHVMVKNYNLYSAIF